MKRRQAIKSIVVVSSGLVIFPACKRNTEPLSIYNNLSLDQSQFNLIGEIADALLPLKGVETKTPESVQEFILTMINDCLSPEECGNYVSGLKKFTGFVQEKFKDNFSKIDADKKLEVFKYFTESEEASEASKFFFDTTRRYTIQHFTVTDYFLTGYLDWKFVPGTYEGCVAV